MISNPVLCSGVASIAAKYPAGSSAEDRRGMLETLLKDRFKLAVHRETRQLQGYALVVAKNGFKLQPLKDDCGQSQGHSGGPVESMEARCVGHSATMKCVEGKSRSLGRGSRSNLGFYLRFPRVAGRFEIKASLKVHPVPGRRGEVARQAQGGLSGDGALAGHNRANTVCGDVNLPGELVHAQAQVVQGLPKDFARMNGRKFSGSAS